LKRKKVEDRLRLWFASADVFGWFDRLNPDRRPSVVWAPGVEESRWFAAEFNRRGISAAHIDGTTDPDERRRVFAESKAGRIVVICSCGVLREGVDLPWVSHGILCQIAAKESAYLQIVGRLLRAAPGKTLCTLQDHSAAYRRHGSPNLDREFDLHDTDQSRTAARKQRLRSGAETEGVVCPKCRLVRKAGPECPGCGHRRVLPFREVVMGDGTLKQARGAVVKKRRQVSRDQAEWTGCLYAAAHRGLTLFAAAGWFARKTGHRLPPDCQPQPELGSIDWSRRAADVYLWLRKRVKK
jgi:superfamily II DNA or RNA helicase